MIRAFSILLISLFAWGPVSAAPDEWTKGDTARQLTYATLHAMDWSQSLHIARNPDQYQEANPLLGKHPTVGRVNSYMATSLLVHTSIAYALPKKYREAWQYVWIGFKAGLVYHNHSIGIRIGF